LEQKYLLLSGFTLEVVQISPANTAYIVGNGVQLNI